MATHSSALAWKIPRTGEPGGLPSMGLHKVRHDWCDLPAAAACYFSQGYLYSRGSCFPESCGEQIFKLKEYRELMEEVQAPVLLNHPTQETINTRVDLNISVWCCERKKKGVSYTANLEGYVVTSAIYFFLLPLRVILALIMVPAASDIQCLCSMTQPVLKTQQSMSHVSLIKISLGLILVQN